jgi:competence CoiA-like predicted nuclease
MYYLDCCREKIQPSDIINQEGERIMCQHRGFIDNEGTLTTLGATILDEFETYIVKTKKKVASEVLGTDMNERVKEYREIFPGKRLPSGELARQSISELKERFVWFFKTYPEYDWDLILDAADDYTKLYEKKNYQFMVTSSYFIKKTNTQTKEITSKLADYCQQILDELEKEKNKA